MMYRSNRSTSEFADPPNSRPVGRAKHPLNVFHLRTYVINPAKSFCRFSRSPPFNDYANLLSSEFERASCPPPQPPQPANAPHAGSNAPRPLSLPKRQEAPS